MKKRTTSSATLFALFAAAGAAACAWAPQAAADDAVPTDLGSQANVGGGQQWTVSGLQPSADLIAAAPAGSLWEATATSTPEQGGIPTVPGFAARATDGQSYPVLWTVPTALGINPSPLPAGSSATGKLYFDVTGAAPNAVTYTRDGQDAATWVQPPPPPAGTPAPTTYGGGARAAYVSPVQTAPAPGSVPRALTPSAPAPAAAAGSSGTPAAPAAGTAAPAVGSTGTAQPATPAAPAAGTAAPAVGSTGTAQPATRSIGTPAAASSPSTSSTAPGSTAATPASVAPTPAPAGAAPAAPAQANTSPAAGNTPVGGTPAPSAAPAVSAPLPSSGSSGTPFTVPTTTPVPVPAG
jgi:hypothetical protein